MKFIVAIEFFLLGVNFQFLMKFLLLKSNVEYIRALKIAKFSFFANYSRRGLCLMCVNTFLLSQITEIQAFDIKVLQDKIS